MRQSRKGRLVSQVISDVDRQRCIIGAFEFLSNDGAFPHNLPGDDLPDMFAAQNVQVAQPSEQFFGVRASYLLHLV